MSCPGRHVAIDDTRLWIVERGEGFPVFVLHGGPGLDHHEFADHLDPFGERYRLILVDQRAQGRSDPAPEHTWTLERMAQDVIMLALALGLKRYAVLGHSFGAFVALRNAVDYPGQAAATIVSAGIASVRYLEASAEHLARLEPPELRERIARSIERESEATTAEQLEEIMRDQWPFSFADPLDPRIAVFVERSAGILSVDVLRHFEASGYGGVELEDRLGEVPQPVLVINGRHDRVCPIEASVAMARDLPRSELVILENSGHMGFVEESESYLSAVGGFLDRSVG